MPTFKYQALTRGGGKKKGYIEADSKNGAFALLQDRGLLPVSVRASRSGAGKKGAAFNPAKWLPVYRVNLSESFFYLSLMLQSGTALADSLDLLGRMSGGRKGRVWLSIRDKVKSGRSFSSALADHPRQFPQIYVGMVRVAESAGKMARVLENIAEYEEQRREFSGRMLTAMAYPAVIMLVGVGAVYFLLARVLPNISRIFADAEQALPAYTRMLLGVGSGLRELGPLVLVPPLLAAAALVYAYGKSEGFRLRIDRLAWKIPVVKKSILARFSGLLGFQIESGIPLVNGLRNAAAAIGSSYFRSMIENAAHEVSAGRRLDKVLARTGAFPDIYLLTLSTGRKAGTLGPFLTRMAEIFGRDVDNTLKRIMAVIEPVLILIIGLIVGFIVLSILTPIFEMSRLVG